MRFLKRPDVRLEVTRNSYRIGYGRTSTRQQDLTIQREALQAAGCDQTFVEQESGAKRDRAVLADVLSRLRRGDTLVVWKLDRLARSLEHLIAIVKELESQGVHFVSLTEGFDTTTIHGKMIFHVIGAIAEFERALIEQRREAGIAKARAQGVKFGRKRLDSGELAKALRAVERHEMSVTRAAKAYGIARTTLTRHLGDFRSDDSMQQVSGIVSLPFLLKKSGSTGH
jgi:DNA invertase Pin-like site-specific DNA recombinase